MIVWRKLASAKWEDAWMERLAFLGPQRLSVTLLTSGKSMRIEAWNLSEKEGRALVKQFGGTTSTAAERTWLAAPAPRASINIRGRLHIVQDAKETTSDVPSLIIPAAMAFGTGDHATTASCLRLLVDVMDQLDAPPAVLDLGTGTGILALAAKQCGAAVVDAFDFDPHAVRASKSNAKLNAIRGVHFFQADVLAWEPDRKYDIVVANLFSEMLVKSMPVIRRSLASKGHLIISGILRHQWPDVEAALTKHRLKTLRLVRKGKWCAALAR